MVNIVLLSGGEKFGKELFSILSEYGGVTFCGEKELTTVGGAVKYFITENRELLHINAKNSVVIVAGTVNAPISVFDGCHSIIVASDDKSGLRAIQGVSGQIITCGMGVRDTVSITSIIGESATVCIKRPFESFLPEDIEESEIKLKNKNFSDFSLMCAGVVLMLNGESGAKPANQK